MNLSPSRATNLFTVSMHVHPLAPLTWLQPKRSECGTRRDARAIGGASGERPRMTTDFSGPPSVGNATISN